MKNRVILVFINLVFILSFFIPLFHDIARAADFPEPYIPSEDTKEQAKKEQYARILFVCMTVDSKSGGEWLPYQDLEETTEKPIVILLVELLF